VNLKMLTVNFCGHASSRECTKTNSIGICDTVTVYTLYVKALLCFDARYKHEEYFICVTVMGPYFFFVWKLNDLRVDLQARVQSNILSCTDYILNPRL
jgi:hypothetical protein